MQSQMIWAQVCTVCIDKVTCHFFIQQPFHIIFLQASGILVT